MKKPLAQVLLGASTLFLIGCPCSAVFFPFQAQVFQSNGNMIFDKLTIQQATTVTIKASDSHSVLGNCRAPLVSVKSVRFYHGATKIGEDTTAPFEFVWTITPGQNGVPTSGSINIEVKALTDENIESSPFKFILEVQP